MLFHCLNSPARHCDNKTTPNNKKSVKHWRSLGPANPPSYKVTQYRCSMNFSFLHFCRVFTQKRWTAQSRNTGNPGRLLSSSNSSWLMGWMCPWAAVLFGGACFSQSRPAVVLLAAAAAQAAPSASSSYASRQPRSGLSALMFCERWEYWFLVSRIIISRD